MRFAGKPESATGHPTPPNTRRPSLPVCFAPRAGRLKAAACATHGDRPTGCANPGLEDKGLPWGGPSEIQNLTPDIRNLAARVGRRDLKPVALHNCRGACDVLCCVVWYRCLRNKNLNLRMLPASAERNKPQPRVLTVLVASPLSPHSTDVRESTASGQ